MSLVVSKELIKLVLKMLYDAHEDSGKLIRANDKEQITNVKFFVLFITIEKKTNRKLSKGLINTSFTRLIN